MKCLSDRMRSRRAGGRGRKGRPLEAEIHRHLARGRVHPQAGYGQRIYLRGILAVQFEIRIVDRGLAAGAGADDRRNFEREFFVDLTAGVADRRARGHHRELAEAIELARAPRLEMRIWVEIEDLRRNARAEPLSRDIFDCPDAGTAVDKGRPKLIEPASDGGYDADPRDHDSIHEAAFSPTTAFTASATFPIVSNSVTADSLALNGSVTPNFSSIAKTISITSMDSIPKASSRESAVN